MVYIEGLHDFSFSPLLLRGREQWNRLQGIFYAQRGQRATVRMRNAFTLQSMLRIARASHYMLTSIDNNDLAVATRYNFL